MPRKIVVAVTGASGAIYAKNLLNALSAIPEQWSELGLLLSNNAQSVWETELGDKSYQDLPYPLYGKQDFSAPFASGSAGYDTLIVVPCSMGTMGRIAAGISDDLLTRTADVMLKERRKLILVARETPYNLIHIKNMETISLAGGIICPATPSFYSRPQTIDEVVNTVVHRVLDLAGFQVKSFRWGK